jgi:BioD-like phosphotransacetylase family protein
MGSESRRDGYLEALNEETHHTKTYPPQDLIAWIKEKDEQAQQEYLMGKLDHNHERAQTTPHNEHK